MRSTMLILIAAAALLVAGCFGYGHGYGHGPHMSWDEHDAHMRGYPGHGYPPPPCDPDAPADSNGYRCRTNP